MCRILFGALSLSPHTVEHVGQFFDELETLARTVASFLFDDAPPDATLLIVATSAHWRAIAQELEARGYPIETRMLDGRLHVFDSTQLLGRLLIGGAPNPQRFESEIGELVTDLAAASPGGLRIFGDMVDVFAERGGLRDACLLEACWNRLAQRVSFSLFCGYTSVNLAGPGSEQMRRAICHSHTRMATNPSDPLGTFLVVSAQ